MLSSNEEESTVRGRYWTKRRGNRPQDLQLTQRKRPSTNPIIWAMNVLIGTRKTFSTSRSGKDSLPSIFATFFYEKSDLKTVVDETHFSKNEVRSIYRAFKETSPNAVINREILREKFAELFPQGDIEHYADLLFDTFDDDGSGVINFQEFVRALSVLCRGTIDEKLNWLYKVYDPKDKGEITWHRLFYVITATDDLIGWKRQYHFLTDPLQNLLNLV